MKRIGFVGLVLAAMVFGTMALAFDAYFSDAAGNKLGTVWEGQQVYIAVKDPEKGACGIDEFQADLVIFDFKTGAYIKKDNQYFRELGGIGSGLYFWVDKSGSNTKVSVPVGWRADFTSFPYGMTHVLQPSNVTHWEEGAWEYVDENVLDGDPIDLTGGLPVTVSVNKLPREKRTARVDFEGLDIRGRTEGDLTEIKGRLENNDTLILIVADDTDAMNIDQDQVKIVDTVGKLSVTPKVISYGCGPACENIVVRIEDPDENLNCNEIEYVPFFVIVNPGSWNPQTSAINNFCSLMMRGGYDPDNNKDLDQPIRWYNIYDEPTTGGGWTINSRFIQYPSAWLETGKTVGRVLFFAAETAVDSGVFEFNFGNTEELQKALGFKEFGNYFTIAFYYIDPNDFDDMDLTTINVISNKYASQVFLTDANGVPVSEVKIGHGGLYVRVYDGDANVNSCCQDKVVVHICDPHNEDDSEYIVIDEISNNSGIFFTQSGIRLEPVWDAVNGYQLVFDDWNVQAFNEDTIFVRYNSVDYESADLNKLGDGNPNDNAFPPKIADAARNQEWDVSFAKVKVYDFQVFDGETHHMRFLDGEYKPVTEIPVSGSLYLEVTDLDQNENPLLRELIFGGWNKDAYSADDGPRSAYYNIPPTGSVTKEDTSQDAGEDSAPIWWKYTGDSDRMTPKGAVQNDPYLGRPQTTTDTNKDDSISGIAETVKIFMWNAQKGTWERMDLRETAVGSGVFRSTVCVPVGEDGLNSSGGDTIMAFYQDPSNHSDIAIISIKVSLGGAVAVTPPTVQLSVVFDKTTYYPGDTVTITVTDEQYAGAAEIVGTNVLVLLDKDGKVITSWNKLEAVAGQPGKFRVTYVLPETVKLGTITAKYTDPYMTTRTAQGQATVVAKALSNVAGITVSPNPFKTSTTFTIQAEPAGAVAEKITITIYDLTGAKVAEITGQNTASVTWNGGNLRNGAYIYVAVVEGGTKAWTFKGFVYIER
ncbi:T9SS type A sorting domain-containing protein [Candidatus Bipolaricaulota bacterium]|nr:T9SS type A sorting domain-containing protein [Candidatus Bipolaricaulota bacterium]